MNSKNTAPDISYYRLSLTDFLRESHPELLIDNTFIATRSEAAAEAYAQAVQSGSNHIEAAEQAFLNFIWKKNIYFCRLKLI